MSSPDIQDAPRIVSPTRAPLYKVAPVTKIRVEPSKALKSPFLVKRQSLRRPDTKILERLYHEITTNPSPIWEERFKGLLELVKIEEEEMNAEQKKNKEKTMINWLNIVVSNMGKEDARDFWNTKCLGWRHYVDPKWAETSMSGHLVPKDLKKLFYGGSVLYNASQSHMVFIPVFHDHQWTLYAFNMCDQKLSILDSQPDTTKGEPDTTKAGSTSFPKYLDNRTDNFSGEKQRTDASKKKKQRTAHRQNRAPFILVWWKRRCLASVCMKERRPGLILLPPLNAAAGDEEWPAEEHSNACTLEAPVLERDSGQPRRARKARCAALKKCFPLYP